MIKQRLSLTRRFLFWFLEYPPYSPYVCVTCSVDFQEAKRYIAALRKDGGPKVSVHHLVTAAVGRTYLKFPMANASVVGRNIVRYEDVGAVMPVDTLDHAAKVEVGLVLAEKVDKVSLCELAERTRGQVNTQRGGDSDNGLLKLIMPLAELVPDVVFRSGLSALGFALKQPVVANQIHKKFPASVVISNAGSSVALPQGALTRSASFSPSDRLIGIGTLFGIFPLQDEVIAVDGKAQVRPMLPITFVFDHRLFDGVMAGRIMGCLAEILTKPTEHFGEDGQLTAAMLRAT